MMQKSEARKPGSLWLKKTQVLTILLFIPPEPEEHQKHTKKHIYILLKKKIRY